MKNQSENFLHAALRCYAAIAAVRKASELADTGCREELNQTLSDARHQLRHLAYLIGKSHAARN